MILAITPAEQRLRHDALAIWMAALKAADAGTAVRTHLRLSQGKLEAGSLLFSLATFERVFLLAAGKASVPMAHAIEEILGTALTAGLVITKHGHVSSALERCSVMEASHPIPDQTGHQASLRVQELLHSVTSRDLLLIAISGGASALLTAPAAPVTLTDKQLTTDLLLRSGASIDQLNVVRKHLSVVKGGQLAALAHPATVLALLLSDVIGDNLAVIGSGLTAPDPSTYSDALEILIAFGLLHRVPLAVSMRLEQGAAGHIAETPKPGDPLFKQTYNLVIGSNRLALEAAAEYATALGYRTLILTSEMDGISRETAGAHAEMLRKVSDFERPACLLSGGETTVIVQGTGKGGRNQEFALAAALKIAGLKDVVVLSAGTDGTDGPTDAAGAIATGTTVARAAELGLDPLSHLERNDAYPFFDRLGDLIRTGPTGTNVMDVNVMLAG